MDLQTNTADERYPAGIYNKNPVNNEE